MGLEEEGRGYVRTFSALFEGESQAPLNYTPLFPTRTGPRLPGRSQEELLRCASGFWKGGTLFLCPSSEGGEKQLWWRAEGGTFRPLSSLWAFLGREGVRLISSSVQEKRIGFALNPLRLSLSLRMEGTPWSLLLERRILPFLWPLLLLDLLLSALLLAFVSLQRREGVKNTEKDLVQRLVKLKEALLAGEERDLGGGQQGRGLRFQELEKWIKEVGTFFGELQRSHREKSRTAYLSRAFSDSSSTFQIVLNNELKVETFNKSATLLLGFSLKKGVSWTAISLLAPLREALEGALEENRRFFFPKMVLPGVEENGGLFRVHVIPLNDETGRTLLLMGEEITAEAELERRWEGVFSGPRSRYLILSKSGEILEVGAKVPELLGKALSELKGSNLSLFIGDRGEELLREVASRRFFSLCQNGYEWFFSLLEREGLNPLILAEVCSLEQEKKKRALEERTHRLEKIGGALVELLSTSEQEGPRRFLRFLRSALDPEEWDSASLWEIQGGRITLSGRDDYRPKNIIREKEMPKEKPLEPVDVHPWPELFFQGRPYFLNLKNASPKERSFLERWGLKSWFCVPLLRGGEVLGAFELRNYTDLGQEPLSEQGSWERVVSLLGAVLELDRLKREIRESRQNYLGLFDRIEGGVYLVDPEKMRLLYVNPFWGIDPALFEGSPCHKLLYGREEICPFCLLPSGKGREGAVSLEYEDQEKERFFQVSQKIVELPGAGDALLSLSMDITEQKLYQKKVKLSQKMEVVGQLAGGFAHDFNNILAGMSGNLQMIELAKEREKVDLYVSRLKGITEKAASLVHQILSFSREQGIEKRRENLSKILDETVEMARHSVPRRILLEKAVKEGLEVEGDSNQLMQIFLNLIINARDALECSSSEVPTITVTLTARTLGPQERKKTGLSKGKYALLEVGDNGCGIEESIRDKIFVPFFTTKKRSGDKGTGLGLSIAYRVVRLHDGWIDFTSRQGQGTVFSVYLPLAGKESPREEPKRILSQDGLRDLTGAFRGTALIVDDEDSLREVEKELLEMMGFEVAETDNGRDGWEVLKNNTIDLMLLDWVMPGMNGEEILDKLREHPEVKTKVLVVTGVLGDEIEGVAYQKGAAEVIQKPFSLDFLASRIRHVLGGEGAVRGQGSQ